MAIKKSDLYASLWTSCDELRGGMDASQYKDYVLVMLFIKYISDKYAGQPFAPIQVPAGASFADMVALKGQSTIGDDINKKIIAPLANANKLADMPDFNDANKLGTGKEMVERLTNLIAIFENPVLDFSKNRADGDDILGDAYEYLMRHFATDSGKSKGQFYTPAEVSRIMAKILGIGSASTTNRTTVYDPTCGSGSLLLKVSDEASADVTLYGQEKDAATSGLARMNMILHNNPGALIEQGNTLADPKFKDGEALKTFDYVIANPPFSDKRWSTGLDPLHDPFGRFEALGVAIITDRDELDKQIERVFTDAGETVYRTNSGRDLMQQLGQARPRLLCSLVHKFGLDARGRKKQEFDAFIKELEAQPSQTVGEVFLFVDECHRTQNGRLHRVMKAMMPNAVFIGFTGTPLLKEDKATYGASAI
ncbi:N-6 DNA methylase [Ralstonia pseudosolanacearum]|uniref:N-6 DNA methylase n=1 Tax=Ralstonia pseudosolanacearum TaxID=1310165 RepID=UPI003AAE0EC9